MGYINQQEAIRLAEIASEKKVSLAQIKAGNNVPTPIAEPTPIAGPPRRIGPKLRRRLARRKNM